MNEAFNELYATDWTNLVQQAAHAAEQNGMTKPVIKVMVCEGDKEITLNNTSQDSVAHWLQRYVERELKKRRDECVTT